MQQLVLDNQNCMESLGLYTLGEPKAEQEK